MELQLFLAIKTAGHNPRTASMVYLELALLSQVLGEVITVQMLPQGSSITQKNFLVPFLSFPKGLKIAGVFDKRRNGARPC